MTNSKIFYYLYVASVYHNHVAYLSVNSTLVILCSDSAIALTGSKDSSVHAVNISTGKVVSSFSTHSDSIECIGFAESSPWAATGSMDKKLIIWDLQHSSPRCTCDHENGFPIGLMLFWLTSLSGLLERGRLLLLLRLRK
ncbi:transducin family protein/WD-40 repeat family protein [Abeliophyllum distichum]|uniref:Transducin family protein/WD-40 repeat family protein n=1 Tax=Abeliophyllum distichum TaxID=126358 RepID=A0ABD1VY13_9LAMI